MHSVVQSERDPGPITTDAGCYIGRGCSFMKRSFVVMGPRVRGDDQEGGLPGPHRLLAPGQMHRAIAARRMRLDLPGLGIVGGDDR
jgi:hypothetical protein